MLKGIQRVDDALRAVDALQALPGIVGALAGRAAVLLDSGIRTGADADADADIALALGADAVLIGRPYAFGLALGGEDGVRHVLRSVFAELDLTLTLAGFADLASLRGASDAVAPLPRHAPVLTASPPGLMP